MFTSDDLRNLNNLTLEEAKRFGTLQFLSVDEIVEDPDNRPVFGAYKTDGLAESIRENGFQGVILVYPFDGAFRLQSGHRSLEAAKKAGMMSVPAIVSDPPKDDIERRRNLIIPNTHERDKTPMCMARMVQYHFDTLTMEKEQKKARGEKVCDNITEKVAKDLEISTAMVTKYRALNKLIPELQVLADERRVSWSELSTASQLSENVQKVLARRITGQSKLGGYGRITRQWLATEIEECRHMRLDADMPAYQFDRNDLSFYSDELKEKLCNTDRKKKRGRKKYQAAAVKKSAEYLRKAFADDAAYREKDRKLIYENLVLMKRMIDKEIELYKD